MESKMVGRYQILSELARGGMATVYLALDPRFDRQVAAKILPPQFTHDPMFRARFEREARVIASLEHQNIVPVYDYGEQDGLPYLVMRYMAGGSLSAQIARGPIPMQASIEILRSVAAALDYAHQRRIVHRDVKPSNIMFDQGGNAYLSDFGIVKLMEGTTSYTGSGVVGTAAYMSPEQVQGGREIDGRSDVYSLGCMIYEMLSGEVPYKGETTTQQLIKHVIEPVPRISKVKADVSAVTEAVLMRAMAKEPEDRYATAGGLVDALADAIFNPFSGLGFQPLPEMAADPHGASDELGQVDASPVGETPERPAAPEPPDHPAAVVEPVEQEPVPPVPGPDRVDIDDRPPRPRRRVAWIVALLAVLCLLLSGAAVLAWRFGLLSVGPALATATSVPILSATEAVTPTRTVTPTETHVPTETPTGTPVPTATLAPTETLTPEPTQTPTLEATETATAVPTQTPTVTLTPAPTLEPEVWAAGQAVNLRAGPGTAYDVVGSLPIGGRLPLSARAADGAWYQVEDQGRPAWVFASLVEINRALDEIPIAADIPPLPTATATATPTPTAAPTSTPTPVGPLELRYSVNQVACISTKQYRIVFGFEVLGGTGQHVVYRDVEDQTVYGPGPQRSFTYELKWGAGYAAVGTFFARSGNLRAEAKFYVQAPNCQP